MYSSQRFYWGSGGPDLGNLLAKGLSYPNKEFVRSSVGTYDERGNIIKEELYGNFTGLGKANFTLGADYRPTETVECVTQCTQYSNDRFNLPLREESSDGKVRHYTYLPGTNLPTIKLVGTQAQIFEREFLAYDADHLLVEVWSDDGCGAIREDLSGVTCRKFTVITRRTQTPAIGFPHSITEGYFDLNTGQKIQLKRTEFCYDDRELVVCQSTFDANDNFAYAETFDYDDQLNLIGQTDPLGRRTEYAYDANKNRVLEKQLGTDVTRHYLYDYSNRLIEMREEHPHGPHLVTKYGYDYLGNRVSQTDPRGHETRYTFDEFGREIGITYPACVNKDGVLVCSQVSKGYNILDQLVAETDGMGSATRKEYTIRGQPTLITYPDGTQERFEYNLNGTVAKKWEKSGLCHSYFYDGMQRVIKTESSDANGNLLQSTQNVYRGANLAQTIDPMGYVTEYTYDGAGRKTQETTQSSTGYTKTCYGYDNLGRLTVTQRWNNDGDYVCQIEEFDSLDRIIEMRVVDSNQTLLRKECYTYDIHGNKTHTYVYDTEATFTVTETRYDTQRRPIQYINALGHTTSMCYDDHFTNALGQCVQRKITTDPVGNQIIEMHDPLGRVVSSECCNVFGQCTAFEEIWYDANGQKVRQKEQVITSAGPKTDYTIDWQLDSMKRPLSITEQGGDGSYKTTRFEYDSWGRLKTITKPDGVLLQHSYDLFGRLIQLTSSDQTVGYTYSYDANGDIIEVVDQLTNAKTTRSYDAWKHLLKEKLANDLVLEYTYDNLGRLVRTILPDRSSIRYCYNAIDLIAVQRHDANGALIYQHTYDRYDLKGLEGGMTLIGNAGDANVEWDALGRRVGLTTAFWSEHIPADGFDGAGNLLKLTVQDPLSLVPCSYRYDDLYQLIEENGSADHTYAYDSMKNRLEKDQTPYAVNGLNQVTSDSLVTYSYDANGNLIKKMGLGKGRYYTYDALNRLVTAEEIGQWKIAYSYDSFGRRLTRTLAGESPTAFIYHQQREIGVHKNATCAELRVLGHGKGAELGAAVAIELEGKSYAPLHDHRGNVCSLLDAASGQIAEFYRYSAFGENLTYAADAYPLVESSLGNRWGCASKRLDQHTGLVQFGKRDYDPKLGRWLTPDPLGFADGPNLYAYVRNNPLILYDPYGLAADYNQGASRGLYQGVGSGLWSGAAHPIDTGARYFNYGCMLGKALWNGDCSEITDKWNSFGVEGQERFTGERMGEIAGLATWVNPFRAAAGLGMTGYRALRTGVTAFRAKAAGLGTETLAIQAEHSLANTAAREVIEVAEIAQVGTKDVAGCTGFTKHGINQAISRDVAPNEILDALKKPLKIKEMKIDTLGRPSQRYIGQHAEVVINPSTKKVVSVNPTSTQKAKKIIEDVGHQ